MSFNDTRRAIEARFQTQFAAERPTVPIRFDNVRGAEPETEPFVSLTIIEGTGHQDTSGSTPLLRYEGEIVVAIFVPEREGTIEASQIADDVDAIFRRASFSFGSSGRILCYVPSRVRIGVDEGGFYQLQVRTPYQRSLFDS